MPKVKPLSMNDLLSAISQNLSAAEILSADVLSDLSVQITKERIRRRMTQAQFAEFLGVSQTMVSKWESQDYNFTIETLCKIAVGLGQTFKATFTPVSSVTPRHIVASSTPNHYTSIVKNRDNVIQFPHPVCMEN